MWVALVLVFAALSASFGLSLRAHEAAHLQNQLQLKAVQGEMDPANALSPGRSAVSRSVFASLVDYAYSDLKIDSAGVLIPYVGGSAALGQKDIWGRSLRFCVANRTDVGASEFNAANRSSSLSPIVNLPGTVSSMTATVWQPIELVQSSGPSGVFTQTCSQALQTSGSVLLADPVNPAIVVINPIAGNTVPRQSNPYFREFVNQKRVLDTILGQTNGEVRFAVAENTLNRWDSASGKWVTLDRVIAPVATSCFANGWKQFEAGSGYGAPTSGGCGCPAGWVGVPATNLENGLSVVAFCVTAGEVQVGESPESAVPAPLALGTAPSGAPAPPSVVLFDEAVALCSTMTSGKGSLVADNQWESIIANVRKDARNLTPSGVLAQGVSSTAAKDLGYYDRGYAQPFGASTCSSRTNAATTQRDLCIGSQVIWDVGGNLPEWVYTGPRGLTDLMTITNSPAVAAPLAKAIVPTAAYCDLSASTCTANAQAFSLSKLFNKAGIWGIYPKTGVYAINYGTGSYYANNTTQIMRGGGGLVQADKTTLTDTRPYGLGSYELTSASSSRAGFRCTMPLLR